MSNETDRTMRMAARRAELRAKIPDEQKAVAALHEIAELLNSLNDQVGTIDNRLRQIERNTAR